MNKTKGIIFAFISAVTYGTAPILISMTYAMGNNSMMMTFLRSFLVIPFLLLYIGYKRLPLKVTKEQLRQLIISTVFGLVTALLCLYSSYNYIPASLASSLHFVYPTVVAIGSVIIFKEEMSLKRKFAVVCSLAGIVLNMDLKGGSENIYIGVGLALVSGFAFAFYLLYLAKSGILALPTIVVTFYMCTISSIVMGLITLFTGNVVITGMKLEAWLLTLLISVMLTILGSMFTQLAIMNVGTTVTSVMATFDPITTIIVGVLLYNETVGPIKLLACFLILFAVFLLALDQKNMAKKRADNIEVYEDIIAN